MISIGKTINHVIADTFAPIYDILTRYKIDKPEKFYSISNRNRNALSTQIALFFKDNLRNILDLINESQGIVFNFNRYNIKWGKLDKVARKAIFYSDVSIILLSGTVQLFSSKDMQFETRGKRRKMRKAASASNLGDMVSILLLIRPLIEQGVIIPLLGDMQISTYQDRFDPLLSEDYNAAISKLKKCELESTLIPVSLDRWHVKTQIEEIIAGNKSKNRQQPVYIYLPHLSNIKTETLLELRQDNYDAFFQFQQALREFLISAALVNSERAFVEIARKVDYEITELELRVKQIEKERRRKGWEIGLGISASALSFVVDAQLAIYIGAMLGSKTVFEGLTFLSNRSVRRDILEDHRYYLAYLAKKTSEK